MGRASVAALGAANLVGVGRGWRGGGAGFVTCFASLVLFPATAACFGVAGRTKASLCRCAAPAWTTAMAFFVVSVQGAMMENANKAKGEAEAILARSEATARGIRMVSESFKTEGSTEAASLRIAEQYIRAFSELAKNTNTMLLSSDAGNPGTMIAQALQIHNHTYQQKLTLGSQRAVVAEEADLSCGMPSISDMGALSDDKLPHQK